MPIFPVARQLASGSADATRLMCSIDLVVHWQRIRHIGAMIYIRCSTCRGPLEPLSSADTHSCLRVYFARALWSRGFTKAARDSVPNGGHGVEWWPDSIDCCTPCPGPFSMLSFVAMSAQLRVCFARAFCSRGCAVGGSRNRPKRCSWH